MGHMPHGTWHMAWHRLQASALRPRPLQVQAWMQRSLCLCLLRPLQRLAVWGRGLGLGL